MPDMLWRCGTTAVLSKNKQKHIKKIQKASLSRSWLMMTCSPPPALTVFPPKLLQYRNRFCPLGWKKLSPGNLSSLTSHHSIIHSESKLREKCIQHHKHHTAYSFIKQNRQSQKMWMQFYIVLPCLIRHPWHGLHESDHETPLYNNPS